jgi:hypothetical protein
MTKGTLVRVIRSVAFQDLIGEVLECEDFEDLDVRVKFKEYQETYWFNHNELERVILNEV